MSRYNQNTYIMSKLSFDELAKKAKEVASDELLNTIAGGKRGKEQFNNCHGDGCHNMSTRMAKIV